MTEDKDRLIHKILSGKGSPSDQEELDVWMSADPRNAEQFQDMKLLYETAEAHKDDVPPGWHEVEAKVGRILRRQRRSRIFKVIGIAFAIAMPAFIAFLNVVDPAGVQLTSLRLKDEIHLRRSLSFAAMPLSDVLRVLEDEFAVTFLVSDNEILSAEFTGTFSRGTDFRDLIYNIEQSEGVAFYEMDEKTFRLAGEKHPGQ